MKVFSLEEEFKEFERIVKLLSLYVHVLYSILTRDLILDNIYEIIFI